jgi:hypothetical protein
MNVLGVDPIFYLQVKFYPPEPILLQEDLTRLVWFFLPFRSWQILSIYWFSLLRKGRKVRRNTPPYGIRCCPETASKGWKSVWREVPSLNHLRCPYTLTNHNGRCMSHVISIHHPGDPRPTAVSDLSKITLCLVTPKFEQSTLVVRGKQYNHSAIVAFAKTGLVVLW